MLTAMLAVRNMMFGEKNDLWSVNVDQEYHEQVAVKPDPRLQDVAGVMQDALSHVFVKLDPVAFGGALGLTMGLVLFLVTLLEISIAHQGLSVFLHNLGEYMPGYQVTVMGGLVGLVFGIGIGFCVGWLFAFLRNTFIVCYMAFVQRRAQIQVLRTILDF